MNDLLNYLAGDGPGPVSDPTGLDKLLAAHWDQFDGSGEGGMEGYKLLNRMEAVTWNPPILSFVVERHGGTVCGSTRAELQHWEVDLDAKTATITKTGHRQLEPVAPRLSIRALADELVELILARKEAERLYWQENGDLQVQARWIFPDGSGYRRTLEGRRMRLCGYIGAALARHGWTKVGWNVFSKASPGSGAITTLN